MITRHFSIDSSNGEVSVTNQLTYEENNPYYYLFIKAMDSPADSRSTIFNLTITITDANNRIPIFTEKLYTASVPENQPNYVVTTVFVRET